MRMEEFFHTFFSRGAEDRLERYSRAEQKCILRVLTHIEPLQKLSQDREGDISRIKNELRELSQTNPLNKTQHASALAERLQQAEREKSSADLLMRSLIDLTRNAMHKEREKNAESERIRAEREAEQLSQEEHQLPGLGGDIKHVSGS